MFGYVMAELDIKAKTNHIDPVNWDELNKTYKESYEID
jgi:hypothetical protein